ncbi:MAG TPA: FliA/WhiG family RNA polymerase sigma factor [Nitrospiraceae bacterium]|nr:FliA/WhiG family RNA polymerase sigma factor [Nitrospiraceae bacterium]
MNRVDQPQSQPTQALLLGDRERIIQEFTHVIRSMAHRLAFRLPAYLDAEDLVSVGIIGLMDAMDKYDPTREAKFKTYAEFRIRGAMLDEIRSMDWIPRSVHERIALLQKTYTDLLNRHGRPPTEEEVAAELKMSLQELDEFLSRARGAIVVSLEDLGVQDQDGYQTLGLLTDSSQPDPLASLVNGRERQVLCQAIQELPEKERLVLTLYYFEELTMKEIGQILKVTESRVCQIHSKAILHLKARLQPVEI